ncbi:MAG: DnaJ C-terminal domain-containing protein, partial [Candidatus Diapherotrites archaeon]|nr:DnaJ C-terminal domain-containing protein [Candidatus Diapherotrites archaeon]
YFSTTSACNKCQGEGHMIKNPCETCDGNGRIKVKRKIEIKIPAGIDSGYDLRIQGEGNAGEKGAQSGDLYATIFVQPHDFFKRDTSDIYCEIPIGFAESSLGTEIEVPTLKGKVKIKIPSGTQTGTVFRLQGQGVKHLNSAKHGDQFVKVGLEVPKNLSKKQKELLEEFSAEEKVKDERTGIFDKIFKAFK